MPAENGPKVQPSLRLSEHDLAECGRAVDGEEVRDTALVRLVDGGLLDAEARPTALGQAIGRTVAAPLGILHLHRQHRGQAAASWIRWSPDGVLIAPRGDDPHAVRDVAFRPATSLTRTLLEMVGWDARRPDLDQVAATPEAVAELVESDDPGSTQLGRVVGADDVTVVRLDIVESVGVGGSLVVMDLGTPGWAEVRRDGDGANLRPLRGVDLLGQLAAIQSSLVQASQAGGDPTPGAGQDGEGGTSAAGDDRAVTPVAVPELGVRLDVPTRWEVLDVPDPLVHLVARQPSSPWFRANVTVTLEAGDVPDDPHELAAVVAEAFGDPVLVDARRLDGVVELVHLHRSGDLDLVLTQRLLPIPLGHAVASWTWAVEQEPRWRPASQALTDSFARIADG